MLKRIGPNTNKTIYTLDRWTGEGSTNEHPRVTSGATSNFVFSDYFIEDGSFLRAQSMQLGYSLGEKLIDKIGIKKLRFYVSVSNAFTLTKYRGFDPSASNGAPIGGGIDNGFCAVVFANALSASDFASRENIVRRLPSRGARADRILKRNFNSDLRSA